MVRRQVVSQTQRLAKRILSRKRKFSRIAVATVPFGMETSVRSSVRSFVNATRYLDNAADPDFARVAIQTARSTRIEMPPIIFSKIFCAAQSDCKPPIPGRASAASGPWRTLLKTGNAMRKKITTSKLCGSATQRSLAFTCLGWLTGSTCARKFNSDARDRQ